MLYLLGPVAFEVAPVNIAGVKHKVGADFVWKDVVGAKRPAEFVGEANEPITLTGQLLPHRHEGAIDGLEALQALARSGEPQVLIRGDGVSFGFMAILSVEANASYLDAEGVGRVIEFTVELQAAPEGPSAAGLAGMIGSLVSLLG